MKGNANDSKHTHSSGRQGIGNRCKRKKKVYVSLLVSNYLHLLNANQKLEVKLFNGIVFSFSLFFSPFDSRALVSFHLYVVLVDEFAMYPNSVPIRWV